MPLLLLVSIRAFAPLWREGLHTRFGAIVTVGVDVLSHAVGVVGRSIDLVSVNTNAH